MRKRSRKIIEIFFKYIYAVKEWIYVTITLSANKINMMPLLIIDASNAVKSYKSELQTLKSKLLAIDSSVCNVDDVISSIKASTQTQKNKINALDNLKKRRKMSLLLMLCVLMVTPLMLLIKAE